jgi:hypothetical protein
MPRREILTPSQRVQLLAFPDDEGELIRRYTLTKADLAFVRQHRGEGFRIFRDALDTGEFLRF